MMIFIAGLAGVDRTLYEASAADGAGPLRRLWHVTLPALRPVFAILFTLAAIRGLRVFTEIFLLTNGGPNGSTEVLMTLIYKLGLERNELGVAAAGSMVLLGATVVLTLCGAGRPAPRRRDDDDRAAATPTPAASTSALGCHRAARAAWPAGRGAGRCCTLVLVAIFAGPLVALLVGAFSPVADPTRLTLWPDELTLDNFTAAFDRGVLGYLLNSFIVVGVGLLLQIVVSVSAAYALARKKFPGHAAGAAADPVHHDAARGDPGDPAVAGARRRAVVHVNLIGTLAGMIMPVAAWAFSILVMTEFMKEIPMELEEAARLDGAGDLRIFWSVVLPLCRPALGVIGIFGFTMIWDQYMLPLLVARTPASSPCRWRCARCAPTSRSASACCSPRRCSPCCPSVLAFLALQRQFMRGLTSGAVKG